MIRMLTSGLLRFFLVSVYFAIVWIPQVKGEETARLGVVIADLTNAELLALGWPSGGGVYVISVSEETAAARAGILSRDLVVEIDGQSIGGIHEFVCLLSRRRPGDEARLTIVRGKQLRTVSVTLGRWVDDAARVQPLTQDCGVIGLNNGSRKVLKKSFLFPERQGSSTFLVVRQRVARPDGNFPLFLTTSL